MNEDNENVPVPIGLIVIRRKRGKKWKNKSENMGRGVMENYEKYGNQGNKGCGKCKGST